MNRYGVLARQHWETHLPKRFRALESPEAFFTTLGQEVQERVDELMEAHRPKSSSDYLGNLQALNMAQQNAESEALRELALLPPETEHL
jgi:hypothetical protein